MVHGLKVAAGKKGYCWSPEYRAGLERGITLVGPHRDDLVLMLGTLPAKGYASHGESWSYALALRLAQIWNPTAMAMIKPMADESYMIAAEQNIEQAATYISPMINGYFR
jgi:hypothetical protein